MQYSKRCKVKNNFFYIIGVGSIGLKQKGLFTYSSSLKLCPGQVVTIELKKKTCSGVVICTTKTPAFKVKPVLHAYSLTIPKHYLTLMRWALTYYPNESGSVIRLFLPPTTPKNLDSSMPIEDLKLTVSKKTLTTDQKNALEIVAKSKSACILHGDTGTGKTQVYIEAAKTVIAEGKSVIVLSPEIGLSEQMKANLENSFGKVTTYHSLHTLKQRREIWQSVAISDKPLIIAGPRSALFLPIKKIGLIILDEAHDAAYKQQQSPYYSTLQMAMRLAQITESKLIYGSATPNVADYFVAKQKKFPIIRMSERPIATTTNFSTSIEALDTRDRRLFSKNPYISDKAISEIQTSIKNGKQSLLLLNRRGTAQLLQCDTCAWQYRCPTCDHTLVYHRDVHRALCHYCGLNCPMITVCPEDSGSVKQLNVGTKFIEEACKKLFPGETVHRVDRDSVDRENVRETMSSLVSGESKILVGTQLLAKGLDLPLLNTIVVLDASAQSSDYLGDERYYQLLHQVIGRGMRGHQNTKVIMQAGDIDDSIIAWAKSDDWFNFYEHEILERRTYNYPPFTQLATIRFVRKSPGSAEKIALSIKNKAKSDELNVEVLGPLPVRSKKNNTSEWVLLVKSKRRSDLLKVSGFAPKDSVIDTEPIGTV